MGPFERDPPLRSAVSRLPRRRFSDPSGALWWFTGVLIVLCGTGLTYVSAEQWGNADDSQFSACCHIYLYTHRPQTEFKQSKKSDFPDVAKVPGCFVLGELSLVGVLPCRKSFRQTRAAVLAERPEQSMDHVGQTRLSFGRQVAVLL